ncbi:MAG: inorganic phosphate transporter [Gammaproteobacteria bacterium]|nr:inorganic phosphate transporter [Gammaproteobacteria bacterium]
MSLQFLTVLALVALLAWANGANDVAKGVATLVGNGRAKPRAALAWGSLWTLAGGLAAIVLGAALTKSFTSGYVAAALPMGMPFVLSILAAAGLWVLVASRLGLPVSTTHALVGGVVGAAGFLMGSRGLNLDALLNKVALPLLGSPLLAIALTALLLGLMRLPLPLPLPGLGPWAARHVTKLHWLSSGATSFARALNDVPKIAAFLLLATSLLDADQRIPVSAPWLIAGVALVMTLGSFIGGYRVLAVLAGKVAPLNDETGLGANLATSAIVLAASPLGLPVSTTHVATGTLLGVRFSGAGKPRTGDALRAVLFGWVVTLPLAAAAAYVLMFLLCP